MEMDANTLMDTSQLECFVQVAANLSFRRAADELHLSQPTVSKQIAALEDEIGGTLFVRTTRLVMLTALGESFLPDAREILRLSYAAQAQALRKREGEGLALGYSDPNDLLPVSPALDALRLSRGFFPMNLVQGTRDSNIERLSRGQLDCVLGFESESLEVGGISFEPLREDSLVCVVRADSALAALSSAGPDDVSGHVQIVCLPMSLRRRGFSAQAALPAGGAGTAIPCATTSEALCLVEAGFGYSLLPSISAIPSATRTNIPWRDSTHATYGIYLPDKDGSNLMREFVALAHEKYGQAYVAG